MLAEATGAKLGVLRRSGVTPGKNGVQQPWRKVCISSNEHPQKRRKWSRAWPCGEVVFSLLHCEDRTEGRAGCGLRCEWARQESMGGGPGAEGFSWALACLWVGTRVKWLPDLSTWEAHGIPPLPVAPSLTWITAWGGAWTPALPAGPSISPNCFYCWLSQLWQQLLLFSQPTKKTV